MFYTVGIHTLRPSVVVKGDSKTYLIP